MPPILPIRAGATHLVLTRLAAGNAREPLSFVSLKIIGMGYGLNSAELPVSPNPRACFWGGWGGSIVVVDLDARMAVAYVMNRMGEGTLGDQRGAGIVLAAFAALAAA